MCKVGKWIHFIDFRLASLVKMENWAQKCFWIACKIENGSSWVVKSKRRFSDSFVQLSSKWEDVGQSRSRLRDVIHWRIALDHHQATFFKPLLLFWGIRKENWDFFKFKDWLIMTRTGKECSGLVRKDQGWSGMIRTAKKWSGLVRKDRTVQEGS